MEDVIAWRRPSGRRRNARWGAETALLGAMVAVDFALSIATSGVPASDASGFSSRRPRVPADPSALLPDLQCLVVAGTAPWMPATWADRPVLRVTRVRTWLAMPGVRADVDLDLATLVLVSLAVAPGERSRLSLDTRCDATVSGPGAEFVVQGSWLAIAWLGHVAGWPDPGLV
ncbi:hypothetical protein GCM10009809_23900 [Isoptericola hypogeus]|uniref:Uncharacterized protein n=1 Tax=Isoptericola hypogeus TaxID=300179 RepID=A0ABN2JHK1_9MICO